MMFRRLAFLLLAAAPFAAAQMGPRPPAPPAHKAKPLPVPHERSVVTHASVTIAGQTIPYTATAGTLLLYNAKHQPTASMFYIAYTRDGVSDLAQRPITFAYNGGPGYASALVDVGGFGPRRLMWPAVGDIAGYQPPYRLVNNDYSILDKTDLVFIDAVGTGYSRIAGHGTPKMFYGFNEDASSFAQFIERYLKRSHRWNSPKFLLGESYGTTRNAVLADDLVNQGVYLNGVIMCSTVLDFATLNFTPGNDLPYIAYLPSYAAVAWYHHRLHPRPATVADAVQAAERYASGPYLDALFAGNSLPAARKQQVAGRLAQLTGIPASLWVEANLRISLPVFNRRVMGAEGPMTGRYDGRFTTPELQPLLPAPGRGGVGPSDQAITGALTAAFDNYLSQTLKFHSSRVYTQVSGSVFRLWDWTFHPPLGDLGSGVGTQAARNVAPALARAMNNDPSMMVMFNNGYYDLATPFFATNYTLDHMPMAPGRRAAIREYYYPVGHMLYVNPKALPQLQKNVEAFLAAAAPHAP
jgi:carboxypeptidase C (cathepsin A)